MKRISSIALVMLAGLCGAGTLQAQSHEVRANVPFNFVVAGRQLPAGSYQFVSDGTDTVVIENRNLPIGALSLTAAADPSPLNVSRLVFHKYGDRYFLSEIRCAASALNVELPRTKLEKQTQVQQASVEPERVVVAAE